jgi:hypothetical protein
MEPKVNLEHENPGTGAFTIKQLKNNLRDTLKKSGVLSTVKAQIRQEFIHGLSSSTGEKKSDEFRLSMSDRIAYSCIYELLKQRKLFNSISVFVAECGIDPKHSLLGFDDLFRMVKLNAVKDTLENSHIHRNKGSCDKTNTSEWGSGSERSTLLDALLQYSMSVGDNKKDVAIQTQSAGPGAREVLDDAIFSLRRAHTNNVEDNLLQPARSIEERMVQFQRDCEKRMAADLATQVAHIRENETTRVRLEERTKAFEDFDNMRKAVEFEYNRRLQAHIDSETTSMKKLSEQEHSAQRTLYEARQLMQREIEDLRARESAAARKQELEAHGIRVLELRLKEAQSLLDSREADLSRREKALEENRLKMSESARAEAQALVRSELDLLCREKSSVALDRQRLQDDQVTYGTLVESAKAVKEQLKQALDRLVMKEEECLYTERNLQRIIRAQQEEEERSIKVERVFKMQFSYVLSGLFFILMFSYSW